MKALAFILFFTSFSPAFNALTLKRTIDNREIKNNVKPEIFESAFINGTQIRTDNATYNFYPFEAGTINIESGKIIACDPIVMKDAQPFLFLFPTGKFKVQLAIAKTKDDEGVAYSRIVFSDKPVSRWEFALQKGERKKSIFTSSAYGYGVDGGIGLFIDEKANEAFEELCNKNKIKWEEVFVDKISASYKNTWQYVLYGFGGHNLASFSTGYGDGVYSSYIGFDDNDKPCRLLTDFGLINWWKK